MEYDVVVVGLRWGHRSVYKVWGVLKWWVIGSIWRLVMLIVQYWWVLQTLPIRRIVRSITSKLLQ